MTQTEYEQKKRECWEEFCDKHLFDPHNIVTQGIFGYAFDLAYDLGKQTEAISQEEIVEAAREAVRKEYFCEKCAWKDECDLCGGENTAFDCCECPADSYEDGFKAGANFALGKREKDADTVIQGWVARDSDDELYFYNLKPYRDKGDEYWSIILGYRSPLPDHTFYDITWDNDPIEVELIIKRKKNG